MPISESLFRGLFGGRQRLGLWFGLPLLLYLPFFCVAFLAGRGVTPLVITVGLLLFAWYWLGTTRPAWLLRLWRVRCAACGSTMAASLPRNLEASLGEGQHLYELRLHCPACGRDEQLGSYAVNLSRKREK